MINLKKLELERVEITIRKYDKKNRCVEEQVEIYYPPEGKKEVKIGFHTS